MDVIGAHASRLPELDERRDPRPYPRQELARALVAGRLPRPAGHAHVTEFGNGRLPGGHDPDRLRGLSDGRGPVGLAHLVRIVGGAPGVPIDPRATEGSPEIRADAVREACGAMGERLA